MEELFLTENLSNLIDEKKYLLIRELLENQNEADVAAAMQELPLEKRVRVFRLLTKDIAAEVFSYMDIDAQMELIVSLAASEAGDLIDNLYADDAADLLEEMPAGVVKKLLANALPDTRRAINQLLKYPDSSAGGVMTVEYVDLKRHFTVADAIKKIRAEGFDKETLDVCYVLNEHRRLIGVVTLRKLILSHEDERIGDIMEENVLFVSTLEDQEEVAHAFTKYDLTAMPVVDSESRLVGIITVDDVVDIIEQEATEDIEMMAAITPTDKPYMKTSVLETFKKRIPWLMLLMISATFTGMIMSSFEAKLQSLVVLAAFIPMLMDTGGNSGSQASVTIIRGLSLGEIEFRDILRVLFKELRVAVLCGAVLAGANFLKMMLIDRMLMNNPAVTVTVAAVVSLTLIITVLCAKLVGCSLPLLAKKIGFDPAVMASPFITTIVDAISLVVYFQIASTLLNL